MQEYRYFGFISYSSLDVKWGKQLQQKLEGYRMPATLCSKNKWERTPFKPIFFAPTDIQPGGLTEELQKRLSLSRNLIVICSPNSAQSKWVGKEIEYFHNLGRTKQIYFFIVNGTPYSNNKETNCINPIVEKLGIPEILAPNIHEQIYRWPWLNKERAYIQLISKLLDVEFDSIWQRHKRQLIKKIAIWTISIISLFIAWAFTVNSIIPFNAEVIINNKTANKHIQGNNKGVATLYLGDEILKDSIILINDKTCGVFNNIPHKYLNEKVRIKVEIQDFYDVDTTITLTPKLFLNIQRNPTVYGHIKFRLWDEVQEEFVSNCKIMISDGLTNIQTTITDSLGYINLNIPLEKQRTSYSISASVPLETNTIYMPCGEDVVILVKQ